jgi:hypothetical protein
MPDMANSKAVTAATVSFDFMLTPLLMTTSPASGSAVRTTKRPTLKWPVRQVHGGGSSESYRTV